MIETQEDLDSLLADLEDVGLGETPIARIRRYVEQFMETLPEDRRKTPHPFYGNSIETFRMHQTFAFFYWMKGRNKDVKILVVDSSTRKSPQIHVWHRDGSANFLTKTYFDSSEASINSVDFLHFEFLDDPWLLHPSDMSINYLANFDPKFWNL